MAALLETVDLEFERVLADRDEYVQDASDADGELGLDTDTLRAALDRLLPAENKWGDEDYAELLDDLLEFDIKTVAQTDQLIETHRQAVMRSDAEFAEQLKDTAYFSHVGLVRTAMALEFGEKYEAYRRTRRTS